MDAIQKHVIKVMLPMIEEQLAKENAYRAKLGYAIYVIRTLDREKWSGRRVPFKDELIDLCVSKITELMSEYPGAILGTAKAYITFDPDEAFPTEVNIHFRMDVAGKPKPPAKPRRPVREREDA